MSLPDVKGYKNHSVDFKDSEYSYPNSEKQEFDLQSYYLNLKQARYEQRQRVLAGENVTNPSLLLYELFSLEFLRSLKCDKQTIFNKYIGFSKKYQSLTISFLNQKDEVQTITIRKAFNRENEIVKWKTYGSKRYMPVLIRGTDSFIFLSSGMAEFLLLKLLDLSYIALQSDSMYKEINERTIKEAKNKVIVILSDNDDTFRSIIEPIKEMFIYSKVVVIDFEKVLGKKLPKGWDFRDTCNLIGNADEVLELLEKEVIKALENV